MEASNWMYLLIGVHEPPDSGEKGRAEWGQLGEGGLLCQVCLDSYGLPRLREPLFPSGCLYGPTTYSSSCFNKTASQISSIRRIGLPTTQNVQPNCLLVLWRTWHLILVNSSKGTGRLLWTGSADISWAYLCFLAFYATRTSASSFTAHHPSSVQSAHLPMLPKVLPNHRNINVHIGP